MILKVFTVLLLTVSLSYSQLSIDNLKQIKDISDNSVVMVIVNHLNGEIYQGSGVVINNDGYIVTNYHVIDSAKSVDVRHFDNEFENVIIIGASKEKDIAILKIPANVLKPILPYPFPSNDIKIGEKIYAISSPLGNENIVTTGVIEEFMTNAKGNNQISVTAHIAEGSSGGAIVNESGQLIGIARSGIINENIYYIIPIEDIMSYFYYLMVNRGDDAIISLQTAYIAYQKQSYSETIKLISHYLDKYINDLNAVIIRGYSYNKIHEYDKAIKDFSFVINNNFNSGEVYFFRGNAYFKTYKYEEAIEDYSKAISYFPNNAIYYYNRGLAFGKINDKYNARTDWIKASELNPEFKKLMKLNN